MSRFGTNPMLFTNPKKNVAQLTQDLVILSLEPPQAGSGSEIPGMGSRGLPLHATIQQHALRSIAVLVTTSDRRLGLN